MPFVCTRYWHDCRSVYYVWVIMVFLFVFVAVIKLLKPQRWSLGDYDLRYKWSCFSSLIIKLVYMWVILSYTMYWWMFSVSMYMYGLLVLVIFLMNFFQFVLINLCSVSQISIVVFCMEMWMIKSPENSMLTVIMIMFIHTVNTCWLWHKKAVTIVEDKN